jgi:DedD protein
MSMNEGLAAHMPDDNARIRRRLVRRMGIAATMILALLGGLALFDYLAARSYETEDETPRFTKAVPVPAPVSKSTPEALGPVLPVPEEKSEEMPLSVPESTETPMPPPIIETEPASVPEEITPPVPAAQPSLRPAPSTPRAERRPPSRLPAPPASPAPAPSALPATPARGTGNAATSAQPPFGYMLQAGVFVDPRRAEDVLAQLAQEGISATLETRVLVGPFKNPDEANFARAKMKAMGIEAIPLVRNGKK